MDRLPVMHTLAARLDRYFFSLTRWHNLGLLRIVLMLAATRQIFYNYFLMQRITTYGDEYLSVQPPHLLTSLLPLPFPIPEGYATLFAIVLYGAAFCACAGLLTRPALAIFGILYIYIVDVDASRGFFNHEASLISQVILALAFMPGVASFSVDRGIQWLRQRGGNKNIRSFFEAMIGPTVPIWGVRLLLLMLALVYITAGLSKIRFTGLKWLDGQTLTYYLDGTANPNTGQPQPMYVGPKDAPADKTWRDGFGIYSYSYGNRQEAEMWRSTGEKIASIPALIAAVSVATVLFELSGFVLLFGGWVRVFYLLGAILMHRSIGMLMNLPFGSYQMLGFMLVDWHWVYQQINVNVRRRIETPILSRLGYRSNV